MNNTHVEFEDAFLSSAILILRIKKKARDLILLSTEKSYFK